MDLNEFAQKVHQNAKDHGWWDEDRNPAEVAALIHSELSEALEEYRADRPMLWYACTETEQEEICNPEDEFDCLNARTRFTCPHRGKKPEGIAVELADCVIRIMDYAAKKNIYLTTGADTRTVNHFYSDKLPDLIAGLHYNVSLAFMSPWGNYVRDPNTTGAMFNIVIALIFKWIREHGADPEQIVEQKHNYNLTRQYKHGGKKC